MTNFFTQVVAKLFTSIFSMVFLFTGMKSGFKSGNVRTPEDFEPVIRFVACSDIHLNGDENQENAKRFANLFEDMYAYCENQDYKKLDAVVVAGDFTGGGAEKEYEAFNRIVKDNMKEETQLHPHHGNQ